MDVVEGSGIVASGLEELSSGTEGYREGCEPRESWEKSQKPHLGRDPLLPKDSGYQQERRELFG
jgi:hypothetical protein